MITVDQARRGPAARRMRVLTVMSTVAVSATLLLTGCTTAGPPDGYIDAYYDNGDPIFSPLKDTLFDAEGAPLCATPIYQNRLETRFRSFSDNGGVMNTFLFEVKNNEQSPDAPLGELDIPSSLNEAQYRAALERQLGSLPRMYQLTQPFLFDPEFGIESADDMAAIKDELRAALPELLAGSAPVPQFVSVGDSWIESSAGRFEVGKIGNVETYMETLGITGVPYDGLNNDYFSAMKDGDQFLMIRERASGTVTLVNSNGEVDIDEIQQFQKYGALQQPGVPESAVAEFTLQNDGCPQGGGTNFARWWITNIEFVEPASPGFPEEPSDDPLGTGDDEEEVSPSPSPSPSVSASPAA